MNAEVARRIYDAYLKIFDMGLRDGIRREMLTWAITENPDHWPVVGVTPDALERFSQHDFQCVSRIGIHRSHLADRRVWQSVMLAERLSFDDWLDLYIRSDQTVLATSSENMKGTIPKYIPIPLSLGLFRSTGYKWRHTSKEREYLRALYDARRGASA
jgi:hypothetical protein